MKQTKKEEILLLIPIALVLLTAWGNAWAMMILGAVCSLAMYWLLPRESRKAGLIVILGNGITAALVAVGITLL